MEPPKHTNIPALAATRAGHHCYTPYRRLPIALESHGQQRVRAYPGPTGVWSERACFPVFLRLGTVASLAAILRVDTTAHPKTRTLDSSHKPGKRQSDNSQCDLLCRYTAVRPLPTLSPFSGIRSHPQ